MDSVGPIGAEIQGFAHSGHSVLVKLCWPVFRTALDQKIWNFGNNFFLWSPTNSPNFIQIWDGHVRFYSEIGWFGMECPLSSFPYHNFHIQCSLSYFSYPMLHVAFLFNSIGAIRSQNSPDSSIPADRSDCPLSYREVEFYNAASVATITSLLRPLQLLFYNACQVSILTTHQRMSLFRRIWITNILHSIFNATIMHILIYLM